MMKLKLEFVRPLECLESTQKGRPSYVAAGSGLVYHNHHFYVVADDEASLACFPNLQAKKGHFIKLFEKTLPLEPKLRKKEKPDLESLVTLDEERLLALPSGSKDNRVWGAIYNLKTQLVTELDLEKSFRFLQKNIQDLNIEGAVIRQETLLLFQRGNGATHANALVHLNLNEFLYGDIKQSKIIPINLGKTQNTFYSFTDASIGPDDLIYFLAAAENSESTYDDGEFIGALIGALNDKFEVVFSRELDVPGKPEGLAFDEHGNFFIITDEDDIKKASILFKGKF
jgi:hypothetical protein